MQTLLFLLLLPLSAPLQAPVAPAATPDPCNARSDIRRIPINDYELQILTPDGWCWSEPQGADLTLTPARPPFAGRINLDWYRPYRARTYSDFDSRVREEIKQIRRGGRNVHVHQFTVGELDAVEVRFKGRRDSVVVEIFIGVPVDEKMGELFIIIFDGADSEAGHKDLAAFDEMIKLMRVSERPE